MAQGTRLRVNEFTIYNVWLISSIEATWNKALENLSANLKEWKQGFYKTAIFAKILNICIRN
ncbi:MAG: hypothetical protein CVU14_01565 [Bacteroidetes bacterium HGW-Bacteroidetes-9]|jgi:hypothetical protein|nr:MAG: hypothetical protein CVU14_01565 [Bacteroidetes bacterium HGW-Bacteroidetes-9]